MPAARPFAFYRMPKFAKWVKKNRLGAAVKAVEDEIEATPDAGDVIPNGGGLRKIRMAGLGRGKSGGFRVVYALFLSRTAALFLDGYSKSEKETLSDDELKQLVKDQAAVIAALTAEITDTRTEGDE